MSTPSKATTEQAGVPVSSAARDSNIHPLVRLTSMHGMFVLETVGQWVVMDLARQEEGTPDSLQYLTDSMRFLMDAVERQQNMGSLCRLTGGGQKAALMRAEASYPVLKEIGMKTDDLEAASKQLRVESKLLEDMADAHAGNAAQVVEAINNLEARIYAVTTGKSVSSFQRRPN